MWYFGRGYLGQQSNPAACNPDHTCEHLLLSFFRAHGFMPIADSGLVLSWHSIYTLCFDTLDMRYRG